MMSSVDPIEASDPAGDGCWFSQVAGVISNLTMQHMRFVFQTSEREPDVVLLGDSILLHMQFTKVGTNLFL